MLGGIGVPELIIIFFIVLLLFGAGKIPKIAKDLGGGIREFKNSINKTDDDKEDLMKDLISIIYSFSARMYGLRRKKNKQEIIDFLEK